MDIYDQLANCLLSIDINIRWLNYSTLKAAPPIDIPKACQQNQAGQFLLIRSFPCDRTPSSLALDRPNDRSTSTSPSLAMRSGTATLPTRRSPPLNPDHSGDTCYNCGKLGHRSPDCPLPRAPRTELKELQELPNSDSENDEHLEDVTGKEEL